MDKQPVGQLPDLTQSNNDDEIMVITNSEYSQLKKEKISDFITDLTSTDENNAIVKGTDGKLFTKDFGNASNITEGTLPTSVLPEIPLEKIPDIPKDKLPQIETDDLPDSGITAGTYTYPTDIVVNSKGQVTSITKGQAGANNANQDLSNLGPLGLDKLNQSKALETGSVSSDPDVYADIQKYAHSTFDKSKFEIVGSPTITDDGVASGLTINNCINLSKTINVNDEFEIDLGKITTPSNIVALSYIIGGQETLKDNFSIAFKNNKILVACYNVHFQTLEDTETVQPNTAYWVKAGIKNNKAYLAVSADGISYRFTYTNLISSYSQLLLRIGTPSGVVEFIGFDGTIDLKQFSITVDGVPVFSGNKTGTDTIEGIDIPYTLSKTGSKIVDAAYRDRVQDMYEQYGYAPYYTIDEENQNFTLPAGEVYGMISNTRDFSLNKTQITDCILEAPNGVATYSGNTITVKQGLKVLIPNGRNTDGTLRNIEVTLDSDKVFEYNTLNRFLIVNSDGTVRTSGCLSQVYFVKSFSELPTTLSNTSQHNAFVYDDNKWYESSGSTTANWTPIYVCPIAKVYGTENEEDGITSLIPFQPVELLKRSDTEFIAHQAMPSGPTVTLSVGASGATYKAPADGWFVVFFNFSSSTDNYVHVSTGAGLSFHEHNDNRGSFSFSLPVAKNQTLKIDYQGTIKSKALTFVYANGAK